MKDLFGPLFTFLNEVSYSWEPLIPERLQKYRRSPEQYDPVTRFFGLGAEQGVENVRDALREKGVSDAVVESLEKFRPAVSRVGDFLIPHHHWGDSEHREDFVYLGRESIELVQILRAHPDVSCFDQRRVLDLGSGSGVLAFELARRADRVLGLELSPLAVEWSNAAAFEQQLHNVEFRCAQIGDLEVDRAMGGERWDLAVFNPPMAVPSGARRPFRDGGGLGIELPLLFLEFAGRHLSVGGEVWCLATDPWVGMGAKRGLFSQRLDRGRWSVLEKRVLNERFNQSLYRKEGYADLGIERVELSFFRLRKLS